MRHDPPDRWARVESIVDRALDLAPDRRAAFVRDACGDDAELRSAVEQWLAACDAPTSFPHSPAAIFAAPLIEAEAAAAADPDATGAFRIGPYRLIRELGRGGMGTVFLAERDDGQFDRRVALKLMRRGAGTDAQLRRRFLEERQILARLEHPHIAALLDGGITADGQPYFVMQYIEGQPIDAFCDERSLSVEARLAIFLNVCDAVQHAHAHKVVHRDLKPNNILVAADGQAKLLDFGIAKLLEAGGGVEPAGLTRTGERLLTPDYASPEQIRGEAVTPASDVYTLGVLLNRLLTGSWPYRRGQRTPHELERAVLEDEPTLPSATVAGPSRTGADRLRRRLRGDLDAIVLQALCKQPDHRYSTAGDLASDIRRHLAGLPIHARGRATLYRLAALARRHRVSVAAGAAGMLAGAALLAFGLAGARPDVGASASDPIDTPVLAIGRIADHRDGHNGESAAPLADMLATNLARTQGLGVVSAARMYELLHQAGPAEPTDESYARAARLAGATQIVDGAIYSTASGGVRLDLRRVDVASGGIAGAQTASGGDLFAVADSATVHLVAELGLVAPPGSVADVTTRSLVAYRLYTTGLKHFYTRDQPAAEAAFEAALREDSTFAMAAYYSARNNAYYWRSPIATAAQRELFESRMALALRLAGNAGDRERLIMRAWYALHHLAPEMRAIAETLAIRYPHEIEGHLTLGQSLGFEGDLLGSIPHFARVFEMDSAAVRAGAETCAACEALGGIGEAYAVADSLEAAERHVRMWLELQPSSPAPHLRLADVLDAQGRHDETAALLRSGVPLGSPLDSMIAVAKHWIRAGELETADSTLRIWASSAVGPERAALLYYHAVALRNQGRLAEALAAARRLRAAAGERAGAGAAPPSALVEAQMLLELRRFREAEALFDSITRWPAPGQPASVQATFRVLALTMVAATQYATGDTTRLAALADSLQRDGERAFMFRPRDQHLYVRGLLHAARGQDDLAIESFQRAQRSVTSDFARVNLELARLLVRHARAEDAIATLRPAARGWFLDTTNLHASLTEIHEMLALAWHAAGRPDSAAKHWTRVARDWRHADAQLQTRRAYAAQMSNRPSP